MNSENKAESKTIGSCSENLDDFLLYLAKHADPKRFMPFPDYYRTTSVRDSISTYTSRKLAGYSFAPYSEEEYKLMRVDLDKAKVTDNSEIMKYITKLPINMSLHGKNTVHKSIIEYQFKYSYLDERIRDYKYRSRWYLFHGSPIKNWHSLLRTGLKNMSNTEFMSAGAVQGPGVYLTSNISLASSYGSSIGLCCVAVVEILIDPAPYNKGNGVFVIPDDQFLVIRYLYRINNGSRPSADCGKEVLNYYKKIIDSRLNNIAILPVKRLNIEEKQLDNILLSKSSDGLAWDICLDNDKLFKIYLHGYPYESPVIQASYKFKDSDFYLWTFNDWIPKISLTEFLTEFKKECFPDGIPEMSLEELPDI